MKDRLHDAILRVVESPPLKRIVRSVRSHENDRSWYWTSGGCFAFAEALVKVLGGELYVVAQLCDDDWSAQHAIMKYRGQYYDATGLVTEKHLIATYGWTTSAVRIGSVNNWDSELPLWYPDQEFVTDEEIDLICTLLRKEL